MAIVLPQHKIAYMALPKAGCTTIKRTVAGCDPSFQRKAAKIRSEHLAIYHAVYPTRRFRPHRWAQYSEGWWRFCIVRDPLERLLSAYQDRVVKRREL